MIKLISSNQKEEWDQKVKSLLAWDVYYLSGYAIPFADNLISPVYCLMYSDSFGTVIYPFHLRQIESAPGYYDIISPYGYGGPLLSSPSSKLAENFRHAFMEFCLEKKIVSEFIRFHPLLQNHEWMRPYMDVLYSRDTIVIDLGGNEEDIWKNMTSKHRNSTRKGLNSGARVVMGSEWISDFVKLYQLTMKQLHADAYYMFSETFFQGTLNELSGHVKLFTVIYEDKVIAGAIVLYNQFFAHYHLAASDYKYLNQNPNNILLFSIMKWAQELGIQKLHLGGGYQGSEDSLFKFKYGFNKNGRVPFYIGKKIIMLEKYQQLTNIQLKIPGIKQHNGYFPEYRSFYLEE